MICFTLMAAMIMIAADPVTLRFLRLPPGGIMLTWLALLVLKLATMLLESTAFRFKLLLLLLLLLMLLLMLITKVMMPMPKNKSIIGLVLTANHTLWLARWVQLKVINLISMWRAAQIKFYDQPTIIFLGNISLIINLFLPIAKEAKSTAFEPLMIEVEAAFVHETAGGALWYMKGRSWVDLFFFFLLSGNKTEPRSCNSCS